TRKRLRPGKLSPHHSIPDQILKSPYVGSKKPLGIVSGPEVHDEKGIEYITASGWLAAQVLQYVRTLVKLKVTLLTSMLTQRSIHDADEKVETASGFLAMPSGIASDDVKTHVTTSKHGPKEILED
ncbi:hypothetical protein Tco_0816182, partial [Tanacetum coccineum]